MAISTGHHGIPPNKPEHRYATAFTKDDIHSANQYLTALGDLFSVDTLPAEWQEDEWIKKLQQQSWFLAGVMTLADWLGSDENHFSFNSQPMPLEKYWLIARNKAKKALSTLPLSSVTRRYEGHQTLFPFIHSPTPLQQRAADLDMRSPHAWGYIARPAPWRWSTVAFPIQHGIPDPTSAKSRPLNEPFINL